MTHVAILRCGKLPSFVDWEVPNLEELFEEDNLLLREFEARGFTARSVVWNQPDIDWNDYDIALIRSTWDYLDELEQFLEVLSQIEASSCRLYNPLAAVRWNIDKHYLFDLEKWGVPVIPTVLASSLEPDVLHRILDELQVRSVVLKPTIGLGGSHSHRVPMAELEGRLAAQQIDYPHHAYLIQPFIESIQTEGEWSFIYFNRRLSHVLLKKPAPNDFRVQGIYGGNIEPANPLPQDVLLAESVIDKLPFDLLYTRLDFVRVNGQLSIMEVELIEPIFSFNLVPESALTLVNAVREKSQAHP